MDKNKAIKSRLVDLCGQTFGELTVISFAGNFKNRSYWECICICGNVKRVGGTNLKSGQTRSCGCLSRLYRSAYNIKHGLSKTKLYAVWNTMKARCANPKNTRYIEYGKRGIKVCDRWLRFDNFYEDMGPTYKEGLSIERVDTNGNYEPSNCKWETSRNQSRNKRNNLIITYNGFTGPIVAICEMMNVSPHTVYRRMRKGWSVESAIETPLDKSRIVFKHRKHE